MTTSVERFAGICQQLNLELPDGYTFKAEIVSVYDHLIQIMGDDSQAIIAWMHTAKKPLNNKTPTSYLETQQGLTLILRLLRKELEMDSLIG